jgi:hypothetical protein
VRRLPLLTTSAAALYRACPRAFYWSQEELVRPIYEGEARREGTVGHRWLEAWWTARAAFPATPDSWLHAAYGEIEKLEDEWERARMYPLAAGYHARWHEEPLRPLAIEREYVVPLLNPATGHPSRTWEQGGKIDVLVEDTAGDTWVMDHKLTRSDFGPGTDYRQALTLNAQVSNYLNGARSLGNEPRGWIHDCIRRPAQRPLKATPLEERKYTKEKVDKKTGAVVEPSRLYANQRAEDETAEEYQARIADDILARPEEYFARFPVVRLEDEVREAAFDMWQVGIQIRESRAANAWPRNPSSCIRFGHGCDWLPICSGQSSPDDGTRYRRAERAHEELSGDVQQSESREGEAA